MQTVEGHIGSVFIMFMHHNVSLPGDYGVHISISFQKPDKCMLGLMSKPSLITVKFLVDTCHYSNLGMY